MCCEKRTSKFLVALFLLTLISMAQSRPRRSPDRKDKVQVVRGDATSSCDHDRLTVFKVTLLTHWSREVFPKQYPEWRPPAQWSKLIGRTHNSSYVLFRVGSQATEGVKEFSETGRTDVLDSQSQGDGGVYDEFNAPPVLTGEGKTEAEFFVDGLHSKVSLASRIVPSPDWFIGLDSFDLCVSNRWIESAIIQVDPMDAGTDSGFTFTAPNWPTVPAEKISRISATEPNHPANSFHYPDSGELPPIATFYLQKVKEYELSDSSVNKVSFKEYRDDPSVGKLKYLEKPNPEVLLPPYQDEPEFDGTNETILKPSKPKAKKHEKIPLGDRKALLNSITSHYKKEGKAKKKNQGRTKKHQKREKKPETLPKPMALESTPPQRETKDCVVSEWSEWTPCSKDCGIGESTRTRRVVKPAKRGGSPCPELEEKKWCGSSRDCSHAYFEW